MNKAEIEDFIKKINSQKCQILRGLSWQREIQKNCRTRCRTLSFPKAEKYTYPRGRKVRNEGKRIKVRGYGRCIDPDPCHRPLPGTEAAHIRHSARDGQLGSSQGSVG